MSGQTKTTGSGWSFGPTKVNDNKFVAADFNANEPLNFDLIDEINEDENKAQEAEGKDWWKK